MLDVGASKNPEILLSEANRLAWLFSWPKAEPLYPRRATLQGEKRYAKRDLRPRGQDSGAGRNDVVG